MFWLSFITHLEHNGTRQFSQIISTSLVGWSLHFPTESCLLRCLYMGPLRGSWCLNSSDVHLCIVHALIGDKIRYAPSFIKWKKSRGLNYLQWTFSISLSSPKYHWSIVITAIQCKVYIIFPIYICTCNDVSKIKIIINCR